MSAIKIFKSVVGTCYNHKDGRYLGKYLRMDSREREGGHGRAPIYVFEKEIIQDNYPADEVIATECITTGGRRRNRRATKKARRHRRRSSRRN